MDDLRAMLRRPPGGARSKMPVDNIEDENWRPQCSAS
jgi:hypothetical protein